MCDGRAGPEMTHTADGPPPIVAATPLVPGVSLSVTTQERVELLDITGRVADMVGRSHIRDGIALVSSMHTTLALFINEFQDALLDDIQRFLEQLVGRSTYWKHNAQPPVPRGAEVSVWC